MQLTAGITKASTGLDGIVWNILGQTYVPKSLSENQFSWHATFPPGTFVPPHIHPTQDEFIYMFEGRMDAVIDGREYAATAGDLIRLRCASMRLPQTPGPGCRLIPGGCSASPVGRSRSVPTTGRPLMTTSATAMSWSSPHSGSIGIR